MPIQYGGDNLMEEILFEASPLQQRTDAVEEKIATQIKSIRRQKRRDSDEMLANAIAELYERIDAKVKSMEDAKQELDDLFAALKPLQELERLYRGE